MEHDLRQPDLIIFDCDGVLVDSEVLSCRCLSDVLATCGITLDLADALDLFLGRSTAAVLQHYGRQGRALPDTFLADPFLNTTAQFKFQETRKKISFIGVMQSHSIMPSSF